MLIVAWVMSAIVQVVKQFDDGEGLLWRPIGRDFAWKGERQSI